MARKFYIEQNEAIPAIAFELIAPLGFVEITNAETLKTLFQKKYIERTEEGIKYYNQFRTQLYIDILNETITEIQTFALENHIKTIADNLINGNWLTAKNTNENLSLSGIYNQEMKDKIQTDIETFINNNY